MMRKLFSILLMLVLVVTIFAGCGGDKKGDDAAALKDGTYTAEEADFDEKSGWKDNVTIEVKDGKIAKVDWNSTHKDGGKDKKTSSKDGDYAMVAKGNAIAEWHEQAEKVEEFLIEKQDVNAIDVKDDGKTDTIAGVTMNVDGFVALVKEALAKAK
ncbi:MAG: hypothetical protein WAQ88_01165 [Caldicoprobacterales bacterium]|jgi:major membrane immunogen (membrane-anchored lipoprotein)